MGDHARREAALGEIARLGQIQALNEDLVERLAAIEHQRWAGWQRHVHGKCTRNPDGSLTIPAGYVTALERQIAASYDDLTEQEREYDREEVRKGLPAIWDYAAAYNRLMNDDTTETAPPASAPVLDETVALQEGDFVPGPRQEAIARAQYQARMALGRTQQDLPHFVTVTDDGHYTITAVPEQDQRVTDICFANRHIDLLAQRERDWAARAQQRAGA